MGSKKQRREGRRELPPAGERYLNRELSWVAFNRRVLEEASDQRHPLLERVRLLSIVSSNLDEFFMTRVAGLKEQLASASEERSIDGRTAGEQLRLLQAQLSDLMHDQRQVFYQTLLPDLHAQGIELLDYDQLADDERRAVDDYFEREIFPVLTPLSIDPSHPFPHISNLSFNLALLMHDAQGLEQVARIKIPEQLPRLLPIERATQRVPGGATQGGRQRLVWIEDVIVANLTALFPGMTVRDAHTFRITRHSDLDLDLEDEEEAEDLLSVVEQGVRERRFGSVVRFMIARTLPGHLLELLMERLQIDQGDVYLIEGRLALGRLRELHAVDRPDLKDPPLRPSTPQALARPEEIFSAIRGRDILLHHPYQSFEPVVDFICQAARDPGVLAIKQTLYRVGHNSPIVEALLEARERGKQVAVLVELKARFDEERNIEWARALEREGVHVAYGLLGLKTHCKMTLVVRREPDGLRRYVHIGTGNYNPATARLYTDLSLLTCNAELGADVSELFNYLTGYSAQRSFRQLLVAPLNLKAGLHELIGREIKHQRKHGSGRIILQLNNLIEPQMIDRLYKASRAGVAIDLVVRGICCLRPGVPGLSETIRVRSIHGRFLEHTRIYYFHNNGKSAIYLASGDLTHSNLSQRVEMLFPVLDQRLRDYLSEHLLQSMLRDTEGARVLLPSGSYQRVRPEQGAPHFSSQRWLLEQHQAGRT